MKTTQDLNQCGLDSLELKALSVPSSLRFLLGIEYDVVLCVNEVGTRRPFRLHFPVFATTFRKLLTLCATRFGLDCAHDESESVLSGTAVMPLLRYADYLPGALHVKEILECLQVEPAAKAKRWQPLASPSSSSSPTGGAAGSEDSVAASTNSSYTNEFEASFIDYSEFASDSSLDDVHGLGFYLMLDYGLSLATHSHLVGIRFHKDWDAKEALREFQEFSGWESFDLRFSDEQRRQEGGVIVMPSSQDACDLLEKYEDEDSDDEGDLLPFILRPVSPLVSVPSLEDSALRKLRDQHWAEVEKHWSHLPCTLNTVVVFNLYDGATLPDILAFFEPLAIVTSEFVEDDSPSHRRRAFLTFASLEATRKALDVDGKNTRGCTLRVQVSPPYISASRRGHEVKLERAAPAGSSPKLSVANNNPNAVKGCVASAPLSSSPSTRVATDNAAHAKHSGAGAHGGALEKPGEANKAPPHPRVTSATSAPATGATATAASVSVLSSAALPATATAATTGITTALPPHHSSPSPTLTRPVNASAAIAGAIAARAQAAAAATMAAAEAAGGTIGPSLSTLSSTPIALPHVRPLQTLSTTRTRASGQPGRRTARHT
ncbi:hypothetical protein ABB37_00554 [Leptomonas pyrrhocoris]|uniref:RRM domain-containing protein n=1 Tax=Leptomonas pyrrhocoris TaxID=157538 RepID=A0A0M9GAP9_LEPPY|nr:hypothetical protein ABB37_00554 [Leptomonas pyrrhocoris]XP_015664796.1 hypothetical protein ABB37_00554 [Leptomonas pyrrhocoris]XP_015664797.1 hypothetical protein ABB37_00554 [Leptomonas pyrrhocoris]KPA86356.1 hypothetical protein ABB37_00554 [Leptomonas pyrrhocoris]KPA86357.1 hypothetical protein ABB37_00554 [Leptomonas pyrrhocoris]KPA86358.1 hypothetical protein ABB37_00554 [Leptomonas pyrrhocoris]|eukprot:XP_015664795.1 hypothetical protein ABB37_00554 [Leptomonas pyrrhocoris]